MSNQKVETKLDIQMCNLKNTNLSVSLSSIAADLPLFLADFFDLRWLLTILSAGAERVGELLHHFLKLPFFLPVNRASQPLKYQREDDD